VLWSDYKEHKRHATECGEASTEDVGTKEGSSIGMWQSSEIGMNEGSELMRTTDE